MSKLHDLTDNPRLVRGPILAIAAVLLLTSVIGVIEQRSHDDATSSPTEPGVVQISGFAFGPDSVRVHVGDTVTWTNADSTDHTVDTPGGDPIDSGSIKKGKDYTATFATAGTYQYICSFHPFMKGTVEVVG